MAVAIAEGIAAQGNQGVMIAVMGASHIVYGSRGKGVPARLAGKLKRQGQTVVLLNPENQFDRKEGDLPVADYLWYVLPGAAVATELWDRLRDCFWGLCCGLGVLCSVIACALLSAACSGLF
jgi:hypothetical protein